MKPCATWGLLLVFITAFISPIGAEIYLGVAGLADWSGDCGQLCPESAHCSVTAVMQTITNGPCNISILGDNYDGIPVSWMVLSPPANLNLSITFISNVSNLELRLMTADANFEFKGRNDAMIINSRIDASSAEPNSKFTVSNLHFLDSSILNSGATSMVEISSCIFTSNVAYTGFLSQPLDSKPSNIVLTDVTVQTATIASSVLVSTTSNGTITMNRVTGSYYQLVQRSGEDLSIKILNSQLSVTFFSNPTQFTTISLQGSALEATDIPGPTEVRDLIVIRSQMTNLNLSVRNDFNATAATFTGCAFAPSLEARLKFDRVVLEMDRLTSTLTIASISPYRHLLRDLQVLVDPALTGEVGGFPRAAPFGFKGNVILHPDSSLTANRLWLESLSTLNINKLTVTELIACYDCTSISYLYSSDLNSIWTFDSIQVQNISVDASMLSELRYRATVPAKGIQLSGSSFFTSPPKVVVFWPTAWSMPNGTWYPLVNSATDSPRRILPSNTIPDEVDIVSQFSAANGIISYSFVRKVICAPPPVGFTCVQGVWVVDGTGNATTVVIVPGNGGAVQVEGNLTVSGPIVFEGTGSSLNVSGCVNTPFVEIEIDPTKVPSAPVLLIQQGKGCPNSLGNTLVSVKQTSESCKKVAAKQDQTSQESLIVAFSVDGTKCSKSWRWIVLGTVLGAVTIVGALTLVIWKVAAPRMR